MNNNVILPNGWSLLAYNVGESARAIQQPFVERALHKFPVRKHYLPHAAFCVLQKFT